MKITTRQDFRIKAIIAPQNPRHVGLGGLPGDIVSGNFEIVIAPRRLGDFGGGISMSDSLASRDIQGDYERRCHEILTVLRAEQHVVSAEITCTETVTCSHCGLTWEEFTQEDAGRYPDWDDPVGLPQCCETAQQEWRAAV
jgi:hypothetical protein